MVQKSFSNKKPTLYLLATPIGNLDEINQRLINTLKEVDVVYCEDTRVSAKIMNHIQIKKPLVSNHEFNEHEMIQKIIDVLKSGKNVGIMSDAGYPLISDPGYPIVQEAIKQHFNVVVVSGSNAALNALAGSGLNTDHFLYYGFLDSKMSKKHEQLKELSQYPYTIVLYEAKHRIEETLKDIHEVMGDRKICLAKELTKLHETYIRGNVSEVIKELDNTNGEFVIVIEGQKEISSYNDIQLQHYIDLLLKEGIKPKAACKIVSEMTGKAPNYLYNLLVKGNRDEKKE